FLLFVYGALNNIGIGSYALTMVTVYLLGLNPVAAFPIMMGACTFSVPIGSVQFIKFNEYSRKITLFTSTFGVLGVLVAVFLVKSLDTYILKWIVILVLLYSAYTMLGSQLKKVTAAN
ncbi:TPA: sulfite exporter TauE/SafE family protein, partial [Enterococcus faecium]|nr:sulfite exporter TauE/SafE family protein [Enterococcus faecium]